MIRSYEKFKGKYPVKIDGKKTFFLNNKPLLRNLAIKDLFLCSSIDIAKTGETN